MTLTLTIQDMDRLSNGLPAEFVLARRGAKIGRSPTSDWCLPDPNKYISSTHCMLRFEGGFYWLEDLSTNGTFLNGAAVRMNGRRRIEHGDRFLIGPYELIASLSGDAVEAFRDEQAEHEARAEGERWQGWGKLYDAPDTASGAPPPGGQQPDYVQPFGEGWTPSQRSPDPPKQSVWSSQEPDRMAASGWSSEAGPAAAARPGDAWGELAQSYVVDWARGGFNQPSTANPDPLGLGAGDPRSDPFSIPLGPPQETARGAAPAPDPQSFGAAPAPSRSTDAAAGGVPPKTADHGALAAALAQAMHIDADALGLPPEDLAQRTGMLMHRLVAGLTMMIEARARAKQQLGAEGTSFSYDDNNPLKFARNTEDALSQLLKDPERGFMDGLRAVEDAFQDLQAHQMATLKAMQGALKATLERFSPDAIRKRADGSGILKIIPGTREAALWKAYEREFSGVAEGSDEAFMDVFAKEFRKAYMDSTR
ncbi:type VI secretion system-associated FHA domain protein TagH [Novosphingobium aquimarinum]|uniref:type VI secretion system-associated FHA domain protein TagH n=1 Tax=Novosphingobium aquimarinum TaxID=2682494 RepID=UPI0012EB3940|nr:type VI secretion system-associated FHA domain protein TagH [Novosphingobium aquimarinum]